MSASTFAAHATLGAIASGAAAFWLVSAIAATIAFLSAALLTPLARNYALRHNLVDSGGGTRKVHQSPIARVGGLAIVSGCTIVIVAIFAFTPELNTAAFNNLPRALAFLTGAVAIAALGLMDDLRGLRARHKLLVQLVVAGMLCGSGFVVRAIDLPGGLVLELGVFATPLTMLWLVGAMNAVNLIDGLDGLAGGLSLIALLGVFALALGLHNPVLAVCAAALAGAVAGFLVYNVHPASVFMGDTGSLFLGYFIGVALVPAAIQPASGATDALVPIMILGVPIADTSLAILRRLMRGSPISSGDRQHLHHRLLAKGMSQRGAVTALYGAAILLTLGAVVFRTAGSPVRIGVFVALIAAGLLSLRWLGFELRPRVLLQTRRRHLALRSTVDTTLAFINGATELDDVRDALCEAARKLGACKTAGRVGSLTWDEPGDGRLEESLRLRFELAEGSRSLGHLELVWSDGREQLPSEHAVAFERICSALARAVVRVEKTASAGARERAG